ncbi:acetolactate synthase small subunit [Flavobacterium saccharophilum]|uniref:Acetolactate synthase small subunit n=1 Tax=Flavobacterium saccharophilum TaxID=29534 RepID=A0A1M7FU35_9FLAO|nr:acetolactate synthase small subunit [Flavobacterium saccharophilum]SHM07642.1 acetolactate synthase, small subunit [Flavobacterium saccharophilum]
MKEQYTLTVYTEDQIGLINKITIMFFRKKINLNSLNISSCEIDNMYRFTIVVSETFEIVKNLTFQIEKIIEVYKCYYSRDSEIITTLAALFKLPTDRIMNDDVINQILRKYGANLISIEKDYTIIDLTGQESEVDELTSELVPYGLIEFIKSSRIALIRSGKGFKKELLEMETISHA